MSFRSFVALFALLSATAAANAAVVARVDRPVVEQNESFTLELRVDTGIDEAPNFAVLEDDFMVGQTTRLSDTRIVNGEVRRSVTWQVTLMAKRAGTLTIPPIPVGPERSNPVTLEVREPPTEPPGEADVFITAEVDYPETWVQAQVLYTIRIYRAVATRQPALREPQFEGAEVLVEVAGDERSYEAILNGRAYNVIERRFALFPQEAGEVRISPAQFEARVLKDGRITGRKLFESEAQTVVVQPIPPPPDGYPNAAWLPAKELSLMDAWSIDGDELDAGEPIARNITLTAVGQLETQLPVIELPGVPGVNVYPDKPVLNRRFENGGIRGLRTDQFAIIGVDGGAVEFPPIELPWWDIEAREWRVESLPARRFTVIASAEPEPAFVEPEPSVESAEPAPETIVVQSDFWRRIAEILGAVWLLTLGAWWWSSRPPREQRAPAPVPIHRQQAQKLKAARHAAQAGDALGVRRALIEWARLEWPERPPRSLGAIADRVESPAADALREFARASYGPGDADFDGAALAKAIRKLSVAGPARVSGEEEPLPPLMPRTGSGP